MSIDKLPDLRFAGSGLLYSSSTLPILNRAVHSVVLTNVGNKQRKPIANRKSALLRGSFSLSLERDSMIVLLLVVVGLVIVPNLMGGILNDQFSRRNSSGLIELGSLLALGFAGRWIACVLAETLVF